MAMHLAGHGMAEPQPAAARLSVLAAVPLVAGGTYLHEPQLEGETKPPGTLGGPVGGVRSVSLKRASKETDRLLNCPGFKWSQRQPDWRPSHSECDGSIILGLDCLL